MEQILDLLNATDDMTFLDRVWVHENAPLYYRDINKAIRRPELIGPAVDLLLRFYPRMIGHDDIKKWVKLSEKALVRLGIEQRVPKKEPDRIEYLISGAYVLKRADHSTTVITKTKRKRHRLNPRQMFETYLILTTTLFYRGQLTINQTRIEDMLAFARTVNNPHHYHKLYQTISLILGTQFKPKQAIFYGTAAFEFFEGQKNRQEMAICAAALANAYGTYSAPGSLDAGLYWINKASELMVKLNYPGQYAYISLQTANLNVQAHEYEAAVQWADQAIKDYTDLESETSAIVALDTRAQAQTYLGNYDQATEDINKVLDYYDANGWGDRYLHATLTLCFIEARAGDKEGALSRTRNAIEMINNQEHPNDFHKALLEQADRMIAAIEDGSIHDLEPSQYDD